MQKGIPRGGSFGAGTFRVVLAFMVAAIFGMGTADAQVSAPVGKPTCYADAVSDTAIQVKWTDIEGETQFRIERITATGWTEIKAVGGGSGNAMGGYLLDTNLEPRKTYYYRVRGWNSAGFSEYSNQAAATTWNSPDGTPAVPTGLSGYASSDRSMVLFWQPSGGAAGYRLESKTGATGSWVEIADVPAPAYSFTHTNLVASTVYAYRLRAYNDAKFSEYSQVWEASTKPPPPPAPELQGIARSYKELELRWNDVLSCGCPTRGDIGYRLEMLIGATWTNLVQLRDNATNFVVSGLEPATEYSFRIQAMNPLMSEWTQATFKTQDAPPVAPQAPVLYAEKESGRSIRVKWLDVDLETEYRIEKRNSAGQWEQIATVPRNTLYYIDAGLTPDTTYIYRIRAANSYGVSPYSNESAGTTGAPPEKPRIYARAEGSGTIQVLWYEAEGAVLYRLERDSGAGWAIIHETATVPVYPEYLDNGLTEFEYYKYRVGAKNAAGTWYYSAEVGARPHSWRLEQARIISAKAISSTAVEVSWEVVPIASGYSIVKLVNGTWQALTQFSANVTRYIDTGLTPGATYSYLVYGFFQAKPETLDVATVTTLLSDNPQITLYSVEPSGDRATLRLVGGAGQTFKIQSSPDFATWSDVTPTMTLSGEMEVSVPRADGAPKMFYRTSGGP